MQEDDDDDEVNNNNDDKQLERWKAFPVILLIEAVSWRAKSDEDEKKERNSKMIDEEKYLWKMKRNTK